jgi:hypothetical protein
VLTVESYSVAVAMCVVTMLCWGSWANTQKLATREWRFQLFYWDYAFGMFLLALILAFTLGSSGSGGRGFPADLVQADGKWLGSAFLGGVIFNLANILLVAVTLIARVGRDQFGDQAIAGLRRDGIDVSCVFRDKLTASGVALIFVTVTHGPYPCTRDELSTP